MATMRRLARLSWRSGARRDNEDMRGRGGAEMRWLLVATFAAAAFALTPSVASAAVTVTTLPTSSFDKNAAYICGQWTSDQPGNIEFEYGLDTNYGSRVGFSATDIGQTSGSDCVTVEGLTPSTTYHFRFVFLYPENWSTTGYSCPCIEYDGSDQSFTTEAGSAPEIPGPTTATQWETDLGFSVQTGIDAEGYPTTWRVDYGTSPTDLSSSTAPQDVLVWPNGPVLLFTDVPSGGTLLPNRVYYWQVVATNTLGTAKSTISPITLGTLSSPLTVTRTGHGAGTVTSSPAGITCGSTCSSDFATGSTVTLTAAPAPGSTFVTWAGGGCTGRGTCTVTMSSAQMVTAEFEPTPPTYALTVEKAGNGSGMVTSSPAGITCGTICSQEYNPGTLVKLTAVAAPGSTFAGWSGGGCSGTGDCTVTTDDVNAPVTATFRIVERNCVVPNLKGKMLKFAKRSIRTRSCTVGTIKHATSRTLKRGHVISQKPKPGSRRRHGFKVNLVVSSGRP
jgi:PASTA domain/Divergent InlB B-repeat domain